MFAGRIVGRVVATRKDESLEGDRLLLVQPTDWHGVDEGDPLVAIDTVGAGWRELVFFVKAREAAIAAPRIPPVDCAIVGIIDGIFLPQTQA
jgi:ethanolamine utilization protein EutN